MVKFLLLLLGLASVQATFSKIVIMVFENHGYWSVWSNSYWEKLITDSFELSNYFQIVKGSQPNYVAMLAGNTFDCLSESMCYLNYPTIMDGLDKKGLTWKSYNEGYQPASNGDCSLSASGQYSRNHNPFLAFTTVTGSYERCQKVLNAEEFYKDLKSNSLPNLSYYVPDNYNNSHDKDLDYSGNYLTNFMNNWYYPYVETAWKDTLFIVTWDEDSKDGVDTYHISTFLKHPCLTAGTKITDQQFDHYSIAAFLESNFGLDNLGQYDVTANNFASVLPSTCGSGGSGGSKTHSGETDKGPKIPYDDGYTSADGMIQSLHSITKDNNVLIMICLSVAFLSIPVFRLIAMQWRSMQEESILQPTWKTPLVNESDFYHAYTNLSSVYHQQERQRPLYIHV